MAKFPCPYLNCEVELTEEREKHILEHHANNRTFRESIHLLTDCSSPIPGSEAVTEDAVGELVKRYGIQLAEAEGLML